MNLYFAPLEGITTYTYRNLHWEMFGGCDVYFAPFITPTENELLKRKTLRDVLPENNSVTLQPQCLANSPAAFVDLTEKLFALGYKTVNLNLGCPSGTVVKKAKGAGALKDLARLQDFFDYIFKYSRTEISVKTRTGFYSQDEFPEILKLYNSYPISELIVHPRVREDYYKGEPSAEAFRYAAKSAKARLCYNGNIYSASDYEKIKADYPLLSSVMIGRGAITNPAIFREIKGGPSLKTKELLAFSKELEKRYLEVLGSEVYTLHKLKEIWLCSAENYPAETKIRKAIKKAGNLAQLSSAINCLPEI